MVLYYYVQIGDNTWKMLILQLISHTSVHMVHWMTMSEVSIVSMDFLVLTKSQSQSQKLRDNLSGPSLTYHEVFAFAIAISLNKKVQCQ